ncbi:unnamed protein product [Natator depressus]
MRASLAICILAALLVMGACLKCEVCEEPGTNCTGDLEACAAGEDICGIARTEVTWAGRKTQTILKGCVTSSQCRSSPVSVNFGNGMEITMRFTCCMGDACRTSAVTAPPADPKPSGRRCRGCYVLNAAQCNEQTTECAGSETQRLDAAGIVTIGGSQIQTIMKGCASESFCAQIKAGSGTVAGIGADLTTVKCTVASGVAGAAPETTTSSVAGAAPGPAGHLLPALPGLLLLTLLS